jgi:hypothetical protein
MIYYEKLGLLQLLSLRLTKKHVFYGSKSIATRLIEKLNIKTNAKIITFGDVQTATNIRRDAYQTAELYLDKVGGKQWAAELSGYLGIDFSLIVIKFFFDELYTKYEFIELVLRYAQEHPNESHLIYVDKQFLEPYEDKLNGKVKVRILRAFDAVNFLTIFLLPGFLNIFWRKNGVAGDKCFNDQIIYGIDGEKLYEMFSNIFQSFPSKEFVIEKRRATEEFSNERLNELQIKVLGLTKGDYLYLRNATYKFIFCCLKHYKETSIYGSKLFRIFYALIVGKAAAIQGTGNLFFTYEHSLLTQDVRNEFLKSGGNRSIFVPMNAHATPRYFHYEIFVNYDVMCAAGKHIEDLYKERKSLTNIFLPTGSYDSHRGSVRDRNKAERIARLNAFKGNSVAITILSPGICDLTYSHEVRLMKLARDLSRQHGVKVFVRMKPVLPIAKYADFYNTHTAGCDSILLTFSEYELMDFLDVTDLFVTSISNSACDLALCGGQVMFIDYMKEPDLQLFRSVVKEVVFTEDESFQSIMDWVNDSEHGEFRAKHKEIMHKLTDYLGYQFPDFDSYRENLLAQLRLTFKNHPALMAIEGSQSGGSVSVH